MEFSMDSSSKLISFFNGIVKSTTSSSSPHRSTDLLCPPLFLFVSGKQRWSVIAKRSGEIKPRLSITQAISTFSYVGAPPRFLNSETSQNRPTLYEVAEE